MQNWKRGLWTDLDKGQRALLILCVLVSLLALIQGMHRSKKGRNALLKWAPVFESIESNEPIYGVGEEGYPTLPVTLMVMAPFHALGPLPGAFAWATARILLAWWIVWMCFRLAAGRARDVPWQSQLLVLLLCLRILHSEIQHANINLWVAACLVLAALHWSRKQNATSGAWIGFGAGLKVTPALGAILFARQRSVPGILGLGAGLGVAMALPALWLGIQRTIQMTGRWAEQMLMPYLQGRELALRQTEHINQSLLGLLGRLCTDSVAIPARKAWPAEDISIGLVHLDPSSFRILHLLVSLVVIGFLWVSCRAPRKFSPRENSADSPLGMHALGLFGMLSLAMLLLSERSWKHHHVVFPLAATYLALWRPNAGMVTKSLLASRVARGSLLVAIGLILGSGEGILGKRGADWAEAWGAYTWATLAMFCAIGLCLRKSALVENPGGDPTESPTGDPRAQGTQATESPNHL